MLTFNYLYFSATIITQKQQNNCLDSKDQIYRTLTIFFLLSIWVCNFKYVLSWPFPQSSQEWLPLLYWQVVNVSFAFELMQDGGLEKPKPRPEGTYSTFFVSP